MRALLWKDCKQLIRPRRLILFFLCLLLVYGAVRFGAGESETQETQAGVHLGIVNEDTSSYAQLLIDFYQESETFSSYVTLFVGTKEEVTERFMQGELDLYLVIPENFAEAMIYLEHHPVQVVLSTRNTTVEILMKNLMESYEKYISAVEVNCVALHEVMIAEGSGAQEAARINDRISLELILMALDKDAIFVRESVEEKAALGLETYYLLELVFLAVAYVAFFAGLQLRKEHQAGTINRLIVAGNSVFGIFFEKLLFSLTQIMLLFVCLWGVLCAAGGSIAFDAVLFCCLTAVGMTAGMLCFAAAASSMKNYLLSTHLYLLLGAMLGGGMIPYWYLPDRMRMLAGWSPNYWFLRGMQSLEQGSFRLSPVGIALLLVFFLCLTAAAGWMYRKRGGLCR